MVFLKITTASLILFFSAIPYLGSAVELNKQILYEDVLTLLPEVKKWFAEINEKYQDKAKPVSSYAFKKLSFYFSKKTLKNSKVIILDECPFPPLSKMNISHYKEIEKEVSGDSEGVTWGNIFCIQSDSAESEEVYFHELIHVVQWKHLGTDQFLAKWAFWTLTTGYENNPIEKMAFHYEDRFEAGETPYNVEKSIKLEIQKWDNGIKNNTMP